jgi:hypothetical protein
MANDIRALVPMLRHTEAARDLRLLALRYEKLANYLQEAEHGHLEPCELGPVHRLQAG